MHTRAHGQWPRSAFTSQSDLSSPRPPPTRVKMYGRTIPGSIDPFLAERPASSAGRRDQTSAIFSSVRPLVAPAVHVIGRSSWRDEIPANASWWNKWIGQSAVRQVTCELQFVRICGRTPPRVVGGTRGRDITHHEIARRNRLFLRRSRRVVRRYHVDVSVEDPLPERLSIFRGAYRGLSDDGGWMGGGVR